jgi:hypothetical protein
MRLEATCFQGIEKAATAIAERGFSIAVEYGWNGFY